MISQAIADALDVLEKQAALFGEERRGYMLVAKARAEVVRLIEAEIAAARGQKL